MGQIVVQNAILQCTFGDLPTMLTPLPKTVRVASVMAGNISDFVPGACIKTFVMCSSTANPAVILIQAVTLGAVKKAPCIPNLQVPWIPSKPTVLVHNLPILDSNSVVMCRWGGIIKPAFPGQLTVK